MPDTRIDSQILDAMFDAYIDWVDTALQVRFAYERWDGADSAGAAEAHARYAAALEREEVAADAYARYIADARRFVSASLPLAIGGARSVTELA
jgi:hypothetical protein